MPLRCQRQGRDARCFVFVRAKARAGALAPQFVSDREHNLAEHLALFKIFMRSANFFQGESPIDHGFQSSRKNVA
jgi:hypothetical protein